MKFVLVSILLFATGSALVAQNTTIRPTPRTSQPTLTPEPSPASAATPGTAVPATAAAEPAPAPEDSPERTIARFFGYLQRKEVDMAYDQLTKGTKIAERAEDVKMLKAKTKDAIAVFGAMTGFDMIGKKVVGERLVSYTYVSLGKEFPLRWRFYFYKPQDAWKLIDLRVDDRLSSIFDEPETNATREP
jgi:hypothetical protein